MTNEQELKRKHKGYTFCNYFGCCGCYFNGTGYCIGSGCPAESKIEELKELNQEISELENKKKLIEEEIHKIYAEEMN